MAVLFRLGYASDMRPFCLLISSVFFACAPAAAQPTLTTRWARDVKPDHVLPEYPRPQMVRDKWLNLNGPWQWVEAKEGDEPPIGKNLDGKILAPFPIESALS